jgi:hypothetical protein
VRDDKATSDDDLATAFRPLPREVVPKLTSDPPKRPECFNSFCASRESLSIGIGGGLEPSKHRSEVKSAQCEILDLKYAQFYLLNPKFCLNTMKFPLFVEPAN